MTTVDRLLAALTAPEGLRCRYGHPVDGVRHRGRRLAPYCRECNHRHYQTWYRNHRGARKRRDAVRSPPP